MMMILKGTIIKRLHNLLNSSHVYLFSLEFTFMCECVCIEQHNVPSKQNDKWLKYALFETHKLHK